MKRLLNYPVLFCLITMMSSIAMTKDIEVQVQQLVKTEQATILVQSNEKAEDELALHIEF